MKKLAIIAVALALSACATTEDTRVRAAVLSAVSAEQAVPLRCPRSPLERSVLIGARMAFDLHWGGRLSQAQRDMVDAARVATDLACPVAGV